MKTSDLNPGEKEEAAKLLRIEDLILIEKHQLEERKLVTLKFLLGFNQLQNSETFCHKFRNEDFTVTADEPVSNNELFESPLMLTLKPTLSHSVCVL